VNTVQLITGKEVEAAKLSAGHVLEIHRQLTDYLRAGLTL